MGKANPEKIIAYRVQFRIVSSIIAYVILSVLAITAFVFFLKYEVERYVLTIIAVVELLFTVIFLIEFISKKRNNSKNSVLITTNEDSLIVYQAKERLVIGSDEIYDLSFENKKSYLYTPYSVTTETYNYGKVTIYVFDGEQKYKIRVKNVLNPDRVIEKISTFLKWDEYDPEEDE